MVLERIKQKIGREYVLKGIRKGKVVEIGRFNRRVTWEEVKSELGDLCEEGYTIIMLTKNGRIQWGKNCRRRGEGAPEAQNIISTIAISTINTISSMLENTLDTQERIIRDIRVLSRRRSLLEELIETIATAQEIRRMVLEAESLDIEWGGDPIKELLAMIRELERMKASIGATELEPKPQAKAKDILEKAKPRYQGYIERAVEATQRLMIR